MSSLLQCLNCICIFSSSHSWQCIWLCLLSNTVFHSNSISVSGKYFWKKILSIGSVFSVRGYTTLNDGWVCIDHLPGVQLRPTVTNFFTPSVNYIINHTHTLNLWQWIPAPSLSLRQQRTNYGCLRSHGGGWLDLLSWVKWQRDSKVTTGQSRP